MQAMLNAFQAGTGRLVRREPSEDRLLGRIIERRCERVRARRVECSMRRLLVVAVLATDFGDHVGRASRKLLVQVYPGH